MTTTAVALSRMTFPPLTYLVPELLPRGGLTMLAGAPKTGKSMLALGLALAVAHGGPALGRLPTQPGAVFYVSLDDQSLARMQRRLGMLSRGGPMPTNFGIRTEPVGRGQRALDGLAAFLAEHPSIALVILDTVEHLRPNRHPGQTTYSADVDFMSQIRRVCAAHPDVTIMCLVHTRKSDGFGNDDDDPIAAVSGTHGMTGGADHVLRLSRKHGLARATLDLIGREDGKPRHVLNMTSAGWVLSDEDPDDPALMLSPDDGTLYRALRAHGVSGATAVELEAECPTVLKIGNRLAALAAKGLVEKRARGKYATAPRIPTP